MAHLLQPLAKAFPDFRESLSLPGEEFFASRREMQLVVDPMKNLSADVRFEFFELMAEGGLRDDAMSRQPFLASLPFDTVSDEAEVSNFDHSK